MVHCFRGGNWPTNKRRDMEHVAKSIDNWHSKQPHLLCALTGRMYQQIQSHNDPLCPSILNFTNYKWVSMIV